MADAGSEAPIIIDMGKKKKKGIRALEKGDARALSEVQETLSEIRATLGAEADDKEFLPVVVVYTPKEKKQKRKGAPWFLY